MQKMNAENRKTGLSRLIEIAGAKKWWLFASMFLAVLSTIAQFIPVLAVYAIIVELAENAHQIAAIDQAFLYRLGYISLAAVGAFGVLLYSSFMLSHIAAFNILYEIRVRLTEKLANLSMGYFTQSTSGEIKKIMFEDVEKIELFVAHHIPDITSAIVFPLLMIGYLFYADWRLAIAAILPLPLAFLIMAGMMKNKDSFRDYHDALEAMNSAVVEYVRGMPVVKVFGASADSFRKLKDTTYAFRDYSQKVTTDYSVIYPGFLTIISSSLVFILPLAVYLMSHLEDEQQFIPTVLLFLIVGGGMFFPLFKLMFMGNYLNQISVGVERIDAILFQDEIRNVDGGKKPADMSVEFDHVSFAYQDAAVLKDVSFKAEPNSVNALVGPSGSGKTTIGLLTARFWDVISGSIRIGGVDIRELKTEDLMDTVSFVFQDGFLFFDTIEENIRMGNSRATREEVIQAARAAQCHEFISALPQGYDTLVGEGGTYLSGGEQQRIGIARLILKNSPIIVLDEATAYADPENEGKILEAFSHLINGKTVIVIAHRLSTITGADQILVVDEGEIVQCGRHEQLADSSGLYQSMWNTYSRSREWTLAG